MKDLLKNHQFTKFLPLYFIILSVIILLGTSYGLLRSTVVSANPYTMNVAGLKVDFYNTTSTISITNAAPLSDIDGLKQNDVLDFTIYNNGDLTAEYDVYIDEISSNPSFKQYIRYAVNKNNTGYEEVKGIEDNMLYIDKNQILEANPGIKVNYKIKMWLSDQAGNEYMNKTFTAKVVVVSRQAKIINAENVSFVPTDSSTCRGDVSCNDVQLITEKIAEMLE